MEYLRLPYSSSSRELPFHLSMEEHACSIATSIGCELLFMWRVGPSVIFGRNQDMASEVDVEYCRRHHIGLWRRKSGGGCVYADWGNIMLSYVSPEGDVERAFSRYTSGIVDVLRGLGLNASGNSRNDILINGLKVGGNALLRHKNGSIVHGTMLHRADRQTMEHALTPSLAKLASKGVKSVPSRITTLSEHLSMGIEEFMSHVRTRLCTGERLLTDDDVRAIEGIEQSYRSPEFIAGRKRLMTSLRHKSRFEGVGDIVADINLNSEDATISDVTFEGDFFAVGDIEHHIVKHLRGVALIPQAVEKSLKLCQPRNAIMNLTREHLAALLLKDGNDEN